MANLLVLQYRVCCVAFTTSGNIFGKTELIKTKHKKGKRPFWCYGQLPFFFLHLSFHSVVLSLLLTFFHSLFSSIFPLTFLFFLFYSFSLSCLLSFFSMFLLFVFFLCFSFLLSLSFFPSFFFHYSLSQFYRVCRIVLRPLQEVVLYQLCLGIAYQL